MAYLKIGLWSDSSDLFDYKQSRDRYSYRWYALREEFKNRNILLETFKSHSQLNQYDILIENGIQNCLHDKKYLLMMESPHVRPQDWDSRKHSDYQKIFSWDELLIDNEKYFKHNFGHYIPKSIPKNFVNKKLCCTVAGNKSANFPNSDELYSKRVEFIRWFETYHLLDFDLYGIKWDEFRFGHSKLGRLLNKFKFLRKNDLFPSYKGTVVSKYETMKNYMFSICYENIKNTNGYISEKIFDSFIAGCVPIYWGARAVSDHIPKDCFIDQREFDNYEELYMFMKNMDEKTYMKYLDSIEDFFLSNKSDPFRGEVFAKTVVDEIVKDINDNR